MGNPTLWFFPEIGHCASSHVETGAISDSVGPAAAGIKAASAFKIAEIAEEVGEEGGEEKHAHQQ